MPTCHHKVLPSPNVSTDGLNLGWGMAAASTIGIAPHRTAILRGELSRPVRLAIDGGVLAPGMTFFDYGCGHGEDVAGLRNLGYQAEGWDPAYRPDSALLEADVVNLGYVVNVIANPEERERALKQAWGLAGRTLVIAARLVDERKHVSEGRPYGDGILTGNGTFQRFYRQAELRAWIDETLGVESVAAALGVFLAFRGESDANAYLMRRRPRRTLSIKVSRAHLLYDRHRDLLDRLVDFYGERGRLPRPGEHHELETALKSTFRSVGRAWSVVTKVTEATDWEKVAADRRDDVIVELALLRLNRRPNFTALPMPTRHDVKAFFGSYRQACAEADDLLFSAGDRAGLATAASNCPVGKRTTTDLYVHRTALDRLAPVLRVYEGCARWLAGDVDANLVKLALDKPKVSYLLYPDFDRNPHPTLARATFAKLDRLDVDTRDYADSLNPPILHRKETFVADDYPHRAKFARLTEQEERWGLFDDDTHKIGTAQGWSRRLMACGVALRGHRVVRATRGGS